VLLLSTLIGVVAIILAVVAPVSWWFVPIFALVGASQAGFQLSGFTLVFAFSPPADRPRYIGIANTALAPIAAVSPMLVGWLATITSYDLVFILLALMGTLGAAILHWRVAAPPRHTAEGQG
jgi:predicted MFS family arabinose efflux permease